MLFNSWTFVLFLPAVLALFWSLQKWHRQVLLAASLVFYGFWDVRFLGLLALSIGVDYCVARMIDARSQFDLSGRVDPVRRRWLVLSLAVNLGVLALFKYFDFFSDTLARSLDLLGFQLDPTLLGLVLPVGISFYTFQSMAYTIDVYRGQIRATKSLLDVALYVSFFPQLVAGPIERAGHLLPQLRAKPNWSAVAVRPALLLITWGFYKKLVVADNLAVVVRATLDVESPNGWQLMVGVLAFAFQIYCDFSGYTDIARGVARLLGISLMENFRLPYFAVSPSDFWQRWHISLSTWLRDYLYIPLGGNRGGSLLTVRNLMLTMVLGGLWHGAGLNFLLWGFYHGSLLVLYRALFGPSGRPSGRSAVATATSVVVMQVLTLIGWAIFRAQEPGQLMAFAGALGDWPSIAGATTSVSSAAAGFATSVSLESPLVGLRDTLFLASGVVLFMLFERRVGPDPLDRLGWFASVVLAVLLSGAIIAFGATGGREFLYFQF